MEPLLVLTLLCLGTQAMADDSLKDCTGVWGWRIQLHKHGSSAAAFTKNEHDHSSRVCWMVDALSCLKGVRSLVIDGELVACDDKGLPDFYRLHFRRHDHSLCV
jgi:hypothetical protein